MKNRIAVHSTILGLVLGFFGTVFLFIFMGFSLKVMSHYAEVWSFIGQIKLPFAIAFVTNSIAFTLIFYLYFKHRQDASLLDHHEKKDKVQMVNMESSSRLASLGEMATGFAHEINNPLSVISVNNLLLQKLIKKLEIEESKKAKFVKLTDSIAQTVERISKIIISLRNLAKEGSSEVMGHISPQEVLDEVLVLAKVKVYNSGLNIYVENDVKDETIYCSKAMMTQSIMNLINNSIEATENLEERWIKLKTLDNNENIDIIIQDSGHGIKPEIENKVFEPMFTTKDIGKGLGLGLSLSNSLIEKQGGTLSLCKGVENTTFIISFPKSKLSKKAA